ncbi:hypothetical protein [Virgibacillus indicus]|uniref:hypothetical protein n=1 Tax=Virgibacillus indicus TaxID=2024554 RepID=UPI0013FDE103|nr:hypothetical protein [Virgibacillus indicus]
MNSTSKKNKKPILLLITLFIFIAGLADIKYKGFVFRLLPGSVQAYLADKFEQ